MTPTLQQTARHRCECWRCGRTIGDAQLRQMARTAFNVLNWARREGFKKDQQLDEVVAGFKVDLREFESK